MLDDVLASNLEDITTRLRKDVISAVTQMRQSALNDSQMAIDEERQRAYNVQTQLQAQVTSLQVLASSKVKALERQEDIMDGLLSFFSRKQKRIEDRRAKQRIIEAWFHYSRRMKYIRERVAYLQKLQRTTVKKSVFTSWRVVISKERYERMAGSVQEEFHRKLDLELSTSRMESTTLRTQLVLAQNQIEKSTEEKLMLEERLRSAFLRGVVALNNEALGVLKGGIQGITSVPPPIETPITAKQVVETKYMETVPTPPVVATTSTIPSNNINPKVSINPNHPLARRVQPVPTTRSSFQK